MPFLSWLNREQALNKAKKVPYRLLEADPNLDHGDLNATNMIVQGDNLEALKALLPYFAGQVKCIYIDPPYNTRSAFEHYDDNREHSTWLSMMYPRLELLRELLAVDGSIWVSIDDSESHYLKVIMDEIFGRGSFVTSIVWQKRYSRENREAIGDVHEYVFVYAINPKGFKEIRNKVPPTEEQTKIYRNPNNDPKGRWRPIPMTAQGYRQNQMYPITTPTGVVHYPPEGRCWSKIESEYQELLAEGRIYFGKEGNSQPNIIRYLSEVEGYVPWTWWPSDEVGHTDESKKEIHALFGKENAFETPKPERLLHRIIHIATNPGDVVLDSFLGSGTTVAVAHKMGRRYIGIEMGEHAVTHCVPRLQKVIDGEQGGISQAVNWQGGGGFHFYRLGETIFLSNGTTNPKVSFPALASHIWFTETNTPLSNAGEEGTAFLGVYNGIAYYLLYNGILKDKSVSGGNVLTSHTLQGLFPFDGPKVIYGAGCHLGPQRLKREKILFKQTPYEIKSR